MNLSFKAIFKDLFYPSAKNSFVPGLLNARAFFYYGLLVFIVTVIIFSPLTKTLPYRVFLANLSGQLILDDPGVIDLRLYSVKKAPALIGLKEKEEPPQKKTLKEIYKIFTEKKAIYGEEFKRLYLQYYSKAQHPAVFWGEENAPSNLSEFINNAYLEFSTNHLFRHRWYGTNPVGLAEGLAAVAMLMTKSDFAVIKTGYAQGENGHKIILPDSQVQVKVYKQREPAKIPDSNVLN